jgi:hypothetical protein
MFAEIPGSINITPDAESICGSSSQQPKAEPGYVVCARNLSDGGLELVIPAHDEAQIRHALVRGFFFAIFNIVPAEFGMQAYSTDAFKQKLGVALLKDLKATLDSLKSDESKYQVQLAAVKTLYGDNVETALNSGSFDAHWNTMSAGLRSDTGKAVLYEAADQYYCSADTRKVMKEKFRNTYVAFKSGFVNPAHADFGDEKNPEQLMGEQSFALAASVDEEGPVSFNLFGRFRAQQQECRGGLFGLRRFPCAERRANGSCNRGQLCANRQTRAAQPPVTSITPDIFNDPLQQNTLKQVATESVGGMVNKNTSFPGVGART